MRAVTDAARASTVEVYALAKRESWSAFVGVVAVFCLVHSTITASDFEPTPPQGIKMRPYGKPLSGEGAGCACRGEPRRLVRGWRTDALPRLLNIQHSVQARTRR